MINPTHIESFEHPFTDIRTYYIKGYVDADEFLQAVAEENMADIADLGGVRVVHCLARLVPLLPHQRNTFDFDYFVYLDQEKGRGAFPMTYVDL